MKTIYSEQHRLRDAKTELYGGELVQPFERPSRADIIIKALVESGLGEISDPDMFSLDHGLGCARCRFRGIPGDRLEGLAEKRLRRRGNRQRLACQTHAMSGTPRHRGQGGVLRACSRDVDL